MCFVTNRQLSQGYRVVAKTAEKQNASAFLRGRDPKKNLFKPDVLISTRKPGDLEERADNWFNGNIIDHPGEEASSNTPSFAPGKLIGARGGEVS